MAHGERDSHGCPWKLTRPGRDEASEGIPLAMRVEHVLQGGHRGWRTLAEGLELLPVDRELRPQGHGSVGEPGGHDVVAGVPKRHLVDLHPHAIVDGAGETKGEHGGGEAL